MDKQKLYGEVIDGQNSEQDGNNNGRDQHAKHQNEHWLDERQQAFDASFDLPVQYIRQFQHHGSNAPRLLTYTNEVDGQRRKNASGRDGLHDFPPL